MWKEVEDKLNKSKRRWEYSKDIAPYRCAELFCEKCGTSLGVHDIICTNLETVVYCKECIKQYIKETPIELRYGKIISDNGGSVVLEYSNSYYEKLAVEKNMLF